MTSLINPMTFDGLPHPQDPTKKVTDMVNMIHWRCGEHSSRRPLRRTLLNERHDERTAHSPRWDRLGRRRERHLSPSKGDRGGDPTYIVVVGSTMGIRDWA